MSSVSTPRIAVALLLTASLAVSAAAQTASAAFGITVLSSRPDMISGSDALIQVSVPQQTTLDKPAVKLNGQDVTSALHPDAAAHSLIGLVSGLKVGLNSLEVLDGKTVTAKAVLNDYPIAGPIFSGPQEHPFLCQTSLFDLPDGQPLGDPLDANCSVRTVITYVYKSTEAPPPGSAPGMTYLKPLTNRKQLPSDVAMTTTTTGKTVPYIVRVETGTVNRSIYQFAVLSDPTTEPDPSAMAPPKAWNGRLLFSFGGGCAGGWYMQGYRLGSDGAGSRGSRPPQGDPPTANVRLGPGSAVISDATVGRGYAEVGSTLNVAGNSCDDILSAETMMMVKERFIKAYGKPAFTFSRGGSGGSYQQNQIADHYPGLLDGIIPSLTFPDVQELAQMLIDSRLLNLYFTKIGDALTTEQKRAIAGVAELDNVVSAAPLAGRINPTEYCPIDLPKDQRYNPTTNPQGVRCDLYDLNSTYYGKDPATGFARQPIDNTGVQYGLEAMNVGVITPVQFLDLNQNVGGYDRNGFVSPSRANADPLALRAAYQNDMITYAKNLSLVPIIDVRPYRDQLPRGDNHLKYHSYSYRARLEQANGTYANDVMVVGPAALSKKIEEYAIGEMDQWLTALSKDTSSAPLQEKIIRDKPADLVDACWDKAGQPIVETQTFSGGKCNDLYPTAPSPRMVAGAAVGQSNILKCQLKPIDSTDYKIALSADEKTRLATIFPDGVCDWSKPGVEQQPPAIGPWHSF